MEIAEAPETEAPTEQEVTQPEEPKADEEEAPPTESPTETELPEEPQTPAPKARPKGRPRGSKTVNRRPKATADSEGAAFAAAEEGVVENPPDIFEIIRQRQTAQFERRQAFYQSFLPVR